MAYDTYLAERISRSLDRRNIEYETRHMMGGLTFMVDDKMCVGVYQDRMIVRIDPEEDMETAMKRPGIGAMDITGKPMKGFVAAEPEAVDRDENLEHRIGLALKYNPKARSSKRRKGRR